MKIYTKTGDKGQTDLIGERASKCDLRVDAYGNIDLLNSHINLVMSIDPKYNEYLLRISNYLFTVGHDLSQTDSSKYKTDDVEIDWLEDQLDDLIAKIGDFNHFVLPGGTIVASNLHICRAVCRTCERKIVLASQSHQINEYALKYVNRLSDFLYMLACYDNHVSNVELHKVTY